MQMNQNGLEMRGKAIVVTGASAGVGRATALAFAARGAHVGLLARDAQGLEETRREIEARGGVAYAVPTDMADAQAVSAAAESCERELGPISVWVNNAMATVFSKVDDLSAEEIRRVTEVTYLGTVHGTLAALAMMRKHGAGTIIQASSALAYRAIPLQAPYCAAKHAIRGFTDALRCELLHERSAIQLCSVILPAVNTPQFEWARTHESSRPRPVAPVYQPEVAARAIVRTAQRPEREVFVGYQTPLLVMGQALMPGTLDHYLAKNAVQGQTTGEPLPSDRAENLFEPVSGRHAARGRFDDEAHNDAITLSGRAARALGVAGLLALGALAGATLRTRR